MDVTGRAVSPQVVGTMFIVWLAGVAVFAAVFIWQRRKHRKGHPGGDRRREPPRARGPGRAKGGRRRRRRG